MGRTGKYQLTVAELIAELQKLPDQSMLVETEGCDCTGPCVGVSTERGLEGVEFVCLDRDDYPLPRPGKE